MVLTWNPHMQRKQTIDDCKLCVIMQNTQGKSIEAGNWNLFNTFYSSLCWWEPFQRSSCVEKLVPCIAQCDFGPFLGCVFGIVVLLKPTPSFNLHLSLYIFPFILPSIMWSMLVLYAEKQPHTMTFPPPNFTVGMVCSGHMQWLLTSKHGVYPKSLMLVSSDQTIFPQYFSGSSKCCSANIKSLAWWVCLQAMVAECIRNKNKTKQKYHPGLLRSCNPLSHRNGTTFLSQKSTTSVSKCLWNINSKYGFPPVTFFLFIFLEFLQTFFIAHS